MTSINPSVNALLEAYNTTMGIELAMNLALECWLLHAHNAGLTPDDFKLAIKARLKFNFRGGFQRGIMLHHFVRGDEEIAVTLNEVAIARASLRVKIMDPARASVLEATHRPTTLPETNAVPIGETELMKMLRKAAS